MYCFPVASFCLKQNILRQKKKSTFAHNLVFQNCHVKCENNSIKTCDKFIIYVTLFLNSKTFSLCSFFATYDFFTTNNNSLNIKLFLIHEYFLPIKSPHFFNHMQCITINHHLAKMQRKQKHIQKVTMNSQNL